ncbi:MAG: phosphoribosylamine--glycine ligase [Proteobacteria bacterium]|nr:phosphoribosylamine--glycine ligase [Cystobacterineae bacterium]MCL2258668.1 phosphoribosylamine--glycine ligase [Cystobacterineae bacterium]MCL2314920.1 phosphoribosylamine--glycine ligase [Pseudomonadota bacterium]
MDCLPGGFVDVLLLGCGARENALAWKLSQSPLLGKLYAASGNPGIARFATCFEVQEAHPQGVLQLAKRLGVQLVVVGPEAPLVAGVADILQGEGIWVFGPTAGAAQVEGSKYFAKQCMQEAGVPTAGFEIFEQLEAAAARARSWGRVVVKMDGLAQGKGVVVAHNAQEAEEAVHTLWAMGGGKQKLLLEELLEGWEVSLMAVCDGERFALLPVAQDHKRLLDGDLGPNTGGMGAYSPLPQLAEAEVEALGHLIFPPVLELLRKKGTPFRGVLYAGLMITPQGPKVLEFNCRLGDPEAQVLLLQLNEDFLALALACAKGELRQAKLKSKPGASVAVVASAAGYPAAPRKGAEIFGIAQAEALGAQVFLAGVKDDFGRLRVNGGRVLSVCAQAASWVKAQELAYAAMEKIRFEGRHFRSDIGAKAF